MFFIKCMLPISIILTEGFREFIRVFDPFFFIPNITTLKRKIFIVKKCVHVIIKDLLKKCPHVNISIDIWTDLTMRSFVGYMVHGITDDWELINAVLEFKQIKIRHTGNNIKSLYNDVIIENG
jgi:hypothetical protein